MLLGTYIHTLDNKNRLCLPSKISKILGGSIVISKGFDGCLELRSVDNFQKFSDSLLKLSQNKKDSRIVIRQLLANANELKIDKANRVLIPEIILKEVNIKKDVVLIGLGNKLEIWNQETYYNFKKSTDKIYESIAERLDDDQQ